MDLYKQVGRGETANAEISPTLGETISPQLKGQQFREVIPLFLWVWAPILLLLGLARVVTLNSDISIRQLMQDPTTVLGAPFYVGLISNIGILLWAAAASIALFIPIFLAPFINKEWRLFLLASGLLTTLLLFDDFFLLHDEILPIYLGISGKLYGLVYILLILLYLYRFQTVIRQSKYILLLMALGWFALSAGIDLTHTFLDNELVKSQTLLLEDGTKLMGIAHWLAYFVVVSQAVCAKLRPGNSV